MSFKVKSGKVKTVWLPVAASGGAIARGTIVSTSSGTVIAATNVTTAVSHMGVLDKAIATTDADYAVARLVPVLVPIEKNVVWEGDVTSGLVAADIGLEVDLTDGATINRGASSVDAALCVGVTSSTKGSFVLKLNGSY